VHICFEVEPPQTWYYRIFLNSPTLVILLQVNPALGDELEIVYKSFYETKYTFIFIWSSIFSVGHYHWLHGLICELLLNNEVDYLVHTIRHILNFLQL